MRAPRIALLALTATACSDGGSAAPTTVPVTAAAAPTTERPSHLVPDPCTLLDPADFAQHDVVVTPGVDLSAAVSLATTESAACQWAGDGSWDLLVGRGGAADAYRFDRGFADPGTVGDLLAGDEAFLIDQEATALPEDYDHVAGVLLGDYYVTFSSTLDTGAEATEQLAVLAVDRLQAELARRG